MAARKKYEFFGPRVRVGELIPSDIEPDRGRACYVRRIRRLTDGAVGGWLRAYDNLSQAGTCWVHDDAVVCDAARVRGDASVRDHAIIMGTAVVSGFAVVCEHAIVRGMASVRNCARVFGRARIGGAAIVTDRAVVEGGALVRGSAVVREQAYVGGLAVVVDVPLGGTTTVHNCECCAVPAGALVRELPDMYIDGACRAVVTINRYGRIVIADRIIIADADDADDDAAARVSAASGRVARTPRRKRATGDAE